MYVKEGSATITTLHDIMIDDPEAEGYQPTLKFGEEDLFKLQCLFRATEIQQSAQCEFAKKLFLAFSTGNAEIILYYKKDTGSVPIVKRIPWFQGLHKQISALCFHSLGDWLLCASIDGSLHVLPALSLVDDTNIVDKRWNTEDVTSFPSISSQSSHSKPTALVWWQDIVTRADIAIVGTEYGEVIFVNLETGHQANITHVRGCITSLHICHDQNRDSVSLLITNETNQQWRLILQQRTFNCLRQLENGDSYSPLHSNTNIYDNSRSSTRSRLQGLKQLSVEKLASLRQKLIESRNLNAGESVHYDIANNQNANSSTVNTDSSLESNEIYMHPESIANDTFLMLQCNREGQQLYTCYHSTSNHITIHGPNFSTTPLSVHKVFESCKYVLLTQRFFFITDTSQRTVYIVSDRLSDTRKNDHCTFNPDCIVGRFSLVHDKEVIHAVYRAADFMSSTPQKLSEDIEGKYILPKGIAEIKVELPQIDTCIIVTNHSVYKVVLRKSFLSVFMEMVLRKNELEKAVQLATIFGVNGQQLLEQAGDILLSNKEFSRAVICYQLSKCRLLKSILKFASAGYTADLLNCLTRCLVSPGICELPVATRIHLSNLCVLAFTEMTLRISPQKSKTIYQEFLHFLSSNRLYDEILAVNLAGQTCLWEVLHHLATQRGLYGQMLNVLIKTEHLFSIDQFPSSPYGMLICVSEPSLMQAILVNPDLARSHMSFVLENLQDSQIFVLQRLVTLYDPTNPVIRPRIVRSRARHRTTSYSSQSSQCDSIDITENCDDGDTLVEEILETFLLVLLTLIYKRVVFRQERTLPCINELFQIRKEYTSTPPIVDFKRRPLCSGFSHVLLIRNGSVYTWGSSVQGCLGTGSSALKYGSPQAITIFRTMQVEVLSVSCGHCHSLAVTNNGIYVWGSNQFGQLGLGRVLQCSTPELLVSLAQEVMIDAVAGQYHSVALTTDGRVFTWGWGVHGQLGHGNTDQKNTPTLVTSLLGVVIRYIAAGYAHTLALSTDGVVYAFGCNVFGQLGIGSTVKSSIPVKILLMERVSLVATAYFHNLALTTTNKLYIWGASPQVLRLQAQAQKKTRIQEQQEAIERQEETADEFNKLGDDLNDANSRTLEHNAQNLNAQGKLSSSEAKRRILDHATLKNINVGMLEEAQTHLKPSLIDTSLVTGEIIQITTGCHHNALVTKDGSLYTWGRNLDGQVGNGTRREVPTPVPLCYNPASIFAQVPPRHKRSEEEQDFENSEKMSINEKNGNIVGDGRTLQEENIGSRGQMSPIIKTVGVSCGYDYTIAIQPGGTVLAWGNNSKAQLGRLPARDTRDDKLVLLKASKRVVRLPHATHVALDVPSQVPNIPAPVISYQSYDVPSLAGLVRPLSVIEKTPGELTLHYALEQFSGLYDSSRIMEKCIQLENYQACSKIAILQHNIVDAYLYQLKVLNILTRRISTSRTSLDNCQSLDERKENTKAKHKSASLGNNYRKNTELFNKHVEKNLIESVEDCAAQNKMKIPASKSLNSLHSMQQEFYTFDCQGGSEELCRDVKSGNTSFDISEDAFDSDVSSDSDEWDENITSESNALLNHETTVSVVEEESKNATVINNTADTTANTMPNTNRISKQNVRNLYSWRNLMSDTVKVVKFYFVEMEHEADMIKYRILRETLDFWMEHSLPIQSLENILLEYLDSTFYALGLLLFCQEIVEKYLNSNENGVETKSSSFANVFSTKFNLEICSMLLSYIDQDEPCPEYIKLFSSLTADHYGPPLIGYPGSSGNNTTKQMIEGVISVLSSGTHNPRSFVHIKDPETVYRFLANNEDTMVFTCGHHFPSSVYETDVIPTMETELLTSKSVVLPCTAQFLGKIYSDNVRPEILCPQCLPRALTTLVKHSDE